MTQALPPLTPHPKKTPKFHSMMHGGVMGEMTFAATSDTCVFIPVDCHPEALTASSCTLDGGLCWDGKRVNSVYRRRVFPPEKVLDNAMVGTVSDDLTLVKGLPGSAPYTHSTWDDTYTHVDVDGNFYRLRRPYPPYVGATGFYLDTFTLRNDKWVKVSSYTSPSSVHWCDSLSSVVLSAKDRRVLVMADDLWWSNELVCKVYLQSGDDVVEGTLMYPPEEVTAFPGLIPSTILLFGDDGKGKVTVREWQEPKSPFVISFLSLPIVLEFPLLGEGHHEVHMPAPGVFMVVDSPEGRFSDVLRVRSFRFTDFGDYRWSWIAAVTIIASDM